jgi:hypothetical protein
MSYASPIFLSAGSNKLPLDVDFEDEAEKYGYHRGANQATAFGRACAAKVAPVYEATHPVYPKTQWADLIAERDADDGSGWGFRRIVRAHNQNGDASCVYNMAAMAFEVTWNKMFGDQFFIPLSPMSGYRWNAPGPNSGSNVEDSVLWLVNHGLLPENTETNKALVEKGYFGCTHPANGYYNKFAPNWEATAELFRVMPSEEDGWYRVTTVDGWFSALYDGDVCCGARDWHAILHCGAAVDGKNFYSIYCNSWGPWGATLRTSLGPMKSFGLDSVSKVATMVSRGAYALHHVRRPSFMSKWRADMFAAI